MILPAAGKATVVEILPLRPRRRESEATSRPANAASDDDMAGGAERGPTPAAPLGAAVAGCSVADAAGAGDGRGGWAAPAAGAGDGGGGWAPPLSAPGGQGECWRQGPSTNVPAGIAIVFEPVR